MVSTTATPRRTRTAALAAVVHRQPCKDVPDAVNLEDFAIPRFSKALNDLNSYLGKDRLPDYAPKLVESVTLDQKLLGVPWYHGGAPIA